MDKELKTKQITSYTGELFDYESNFSNEYNQIGELHNIILNDISSKWETFTSGKAYPGKDLYYYTIKKTFELTISEEKEPELLSFADTLLAELRAGNSQTKNNAKETTESRKLFYVNEMKSFMKNIKNGYFDDFFNDVNKFLDDNVTDNAIGKILEIEQKVFYSTMNAEAKKLYLIFCSVAKYSYLNLNQLMQHDYVLFFGKSVFEKGLFTGKGGMIWADAVGAVKGAIEGGTTGSVVGPVGTTAGAIIGGVSYGALSSATEYAIEQTVVQWIENIF